MPFVETIEIADPEHKRFFRRRSKKLKVCVAYRYKNKILKEFPIEANVLPQCKPVYVTLAGWQQSLQRLTRRANLPVEARQYIAFIEKQLGVPVQFISVGPDRKALISR